MDQCPCQEVSGLVASNDSFDPEKAKKLAPEMNRLSQTLKKFATQCKAVGIDTEYEVNKRRGRADKILNLTSCDMNEQEEILKKFKELPANFWTNICGEAHQLLAQRLAWVVEFLLFQMPGKQKLPPIVLKINGGRAMRKGSRYSGGKLYDSCQKLGGIGAILCLPLEIPNSTYTKYFDTGDDQPVDYLVEMGIDVLAEEYRDFVQSLIMNQIRAAEPISHLDLATQFDDILTDSDLMLVFVTVLGGSDIPSALLSSAGLLRSQWDDEGQLAELTAEQFGIRSRFASILWDDTRRCEAIAQLPLVQDAWDSPTFSLITGSAPTLAGPTVASWFITAWETINFVCGAEKGALLWSSESRKALWELMEVLRERRPWLMPTAREQALEAYLFFAENGSRKIRRVAVDRVDELIEPSDSPDLHACGVLFKSIVFRQDSKIAASEACLSRFAADDAAQMQIKTRKHHAILGRLHLSRVENMILRKDPEAASLVHGGWEPLRWASPLELRTNYRMTLTATNYLHAQGSFGAAKDAYLQCKTRQQPNNCRLLVIAKLADVFCELDEYGPARALLEVEIQALREQESKGRLYRRLLLAYAEVDLGEERYIEANATLDELREIEPTSDLDVTDQLLSIRGMMARARLAHTVANYPIAITRWDTVIELCTHLSSFSEGRGFIDAAALASLAHVQIIVGNIETAQNLWNHAVEIVEQETMTYWIPCVARKWFPFVASQVCQTQNWTIHTTSPTGDIYSYGVQM